jgi:transposase
MSVVQT